MELGCLVEGDPAPEVTWYLEGTELLDSLHYRVTGDGNLLIVFMLPQLAGEYVCVAENLVGTDSAVVTVEFAGTSARSCERFERPGLLCGIASIEP